LSRNFRRLNPNEKDTPLTDHLKSGGRAATALSTDQRRRDKFERIALPHLDAAYALARWLTRNEADASDVVQETFLRALRYFNSYREVDAKSWLLKIVRHTCYSWLARNRPAGVTSLEAEVEKNGNEAATVSIDADAVIESRSDLKLLNQLIKSLPVPLREVLVLREFHELGYREIAEVTGVPMGTVMSRLYRARSQLLHSYDVIAAASDDADPPKAERGEQAAAGFGRSAVPPLRGMTEQAAPRGP
jgi:RNA polymerase sigma-70 factor (ECF subfamily)